MTFLAKLSLGLSSLVLLGRSSSYLQWDKSWYQPQIPSLSMIHGSSNCGKKHSCLDLRITLKMFRGPPQRCTMAPQLSQPFTEPGRNVYIQLCFSSQGNSRIAISPWTTVNPCQNSATASQAFLRSLFRRASFLHFFVRDGRRNRKATALPHQ